MKNTITALLLLLGITAYSQSQTPDRHLRTYLNIWKVTDSQARLQQIKTFWTDESRYQDPLSTVKGAEALNAVIDDFQKKFPGAILSFGEVQATGNNRTWPWLILDANHKLVVQGKDFATLAADGKLLSITGFFDNDTPAPLSYAQQANINIAATYFNCLFKTRDFDTMAKIIAPDAIYNQAEGLPYGGTYTGLPEWVKMYTKAQAYFTLQITQGPQYFISPKNEVIIYFGIKCRSLKSNKEISMPVAEFFEIENGLIVNIRPFYYDTKTFTEFLK